LNDVNLAKLVARKIGRVMSDKLQATNSTNGVLYFQRLRAGEYQEFSEREAGAHDDSSADPVAKNQSHLALRVVEDPRFFAHRATSGIEIYPIIHNEMRTVAFALRVELARNLKEVHLVISKAFIERICTIGLDWVERRADAQRDSMFRIDRNDHIDRRSVPESGKVSSEAPSSRPAPSTTGRKRSGDNLEPETVVKM
jgi:hypothetical protein